ESERGGGGWLPPPGGRAGLPAEPQGAERESAQVAVLAVGPDQGRVLLARDLPAHRAVGGAQRKEEARVLRRRQDDLLLAPLTGAGGGRAGPQGQERVRRPAAPAAHRLRPPRGAEPWVLPE